VEKDENIHTHRPVMTNNKAAAASTPGKPSNKKRRERIFPNHSNEQDRRIEIGENNTKNINQDPSQTKYNKGYREAGPDYHYRKPLDEGLSHK
jgi:hypothetical protein